MKRIVMFLSTLALSLMLSACGGGENGGDGPTGNTPKKTADPWAGVGSGALTERGDRAGAGTGVRRRHDCRLRRQRRGRVGTGVPKADSPEETWYEVCMPLEDDPYFVAHCPTTPWSGIL